ncbi:hypothetical protein E4U42_001636 [Claviceps africana]|uniref:DUF2428 domain-containing protein n=1 Tax=Claviceps africana TaxID=83212 RepID=A0A8K0NJP6_9HYPO|nr:hypothetical protein E4U42_001636 [Claviceps africana]
MTAEPPAEAIDLLANPIELIKWLENEDAGVARDHANTLFERLLRDASQPKSVSGQACVRLCGLADQASASNSENLRQWAFSEDVTSKLFNFYIEWNESDNHRSMKLVLDVVAQSILKNPDREEASRLKQSILETLVSIIIGRSTKPVAKSAIKTVDHLLSKGVVTLRDINSTYMHFREDLRGSGAVEVWRNFMSELFHWMKLHFVCPTAGRLAVTIYRFWRQDESGDSILSIEVWHQWLLDFLTEEPALLESIKNYIFLPLFKADRSEALRFLRHISQDRAVSGSADVNMDIPALLQLAALETGKRIGLVEEPAIGGDNDDASDTSSITLQENVLESVLSHPSHDVRSLALSLLVTSPSTTRPYSPKAFELLKKHLSTFFADPDAKFRVDVSAKARDMFKRVRGAIHVLKRSIPRSRAKAQKANARDPVPAHGSIVSEPILYRSNLISLPELQLTYCLDYHVQFLHWYIAFLCHELVPTASYQRHIAGLKALMYIIRMEGDGSKTWETVDDQELFFDRLDSRWARALFDLVMDPFEDVRDMAATSLAKCYADGRYRRLNLTGSEITGTPLHEIRDLSRRANELARRTARADHSDGASKASQLLCRFLESGEERLRMLSHMVEQLSLKTSMAEQDLGRAVVDSPLHGDFASLCHTWQVVSEIQLSPSEADDARRLQLDIVSCCERAWRAVRDILCDDSPEGHLPQELEEVDGLDTKDLLSYSFRAVHESSNLMRTMILTIANRGREGRIIPSKEVFERIGNLTFTQLASLRHRGAFTTVSATFATCCQQTKHLELEEMEMPLLQVWYDGTMKAIYSQASTTRRSAGIPSMITGILAANGASPTFDQVMDTLMTIASKEARVSETDGSNLPQVHAYNCLKDIFKNSLLTSLGNKSESYLPPCLELAARGLRSEVWAIRNCGLIFLRSLIDNLFGTHESKTTIEAGWDGRANRIHYHRYPNLPAVLKNLLQSGHSILNQPASASAGSAAAESVFPALDIVRRAGPPDLLRDEIQVDVAVYLSSPVWHVRDMAARTLCSCLLHKRWLEVLRQTFDTAMADRSKNKQNHIHGTLLTLKFVIERLNEVAHDEFIGDLGQLESFLSRMKMDDSFSHCPDIIAAYLEVINVTWAIQTTNKLPLSSFPAATPKHIDSALFKMQKAVHDVYVLSGASDPLVQLRSLLRSRDIGLDGLVAALETSSKIYNPKTCNADMLPPLCILYIDTCLETTYSAAQVLAIENLTDVMDELLARRAVDNDDDVLQQALVRLWTRLPSRTMNPALSHAVIRVSGCIAAASISTDCRRTPIDLHAWGVIMADATLDDKTFDTRLAASLSLRSFFAAQSPLLPQEHHLPALLALYDALNDDDDQVRDVAAGATQMLLLSHALVPLEAASRLLHFLTGHFGQSPLFRSIVADRLVGHRGTWPSPDRSPPAWEPAKTQLDRVMRFDDSLFAVEEQNLFVDEVRETTRWVDAFCRLHDRALTDRLAGWVHDGLVHLATLAADTEDGPLGWASDPAVFAICTRLVRVSAALSTSSADDRPDVERALSVARDALTRPDGRVSRLLTEPWAV